MLSFHAFNCTLVVAKYTVFPFCRIMLILPQNFTGLHILTSSLSKEIKFSSWISALSESPILSLISAAATSELLLCFSFFVLKQNKDSSSMSIFRPARLDPCAHFLCGAFRDGQVDLIWTDFTPENVPVINAPRLKSTVLVQDNGVFKVTPFFSHSAFRNI